MDDVIINDMALQLTTDLVIEDHPPRRSAKSFHAHLVLTLKYERVPTTVEGDSNSEGQQVYWVPGMEVAWRDWMDTSAFVEKLASIITRTDTS